MRLSREALQEHLLSTGTTLLLESGLAGGTIPLSYADAFRWLEANRSMKVSRAQVHGRIWESLEEYRLDVLLALLEYRPNATLAATQDSLRVVIADFLDAHSVSSDQPSPDPLSSQKERRQLVIRLTKEGVEQNAIAARNSSEARAFSAALATFSFRSSRSSTFPLDANLLAAAAKANYRAALAPFISIYHEVSARIGAQLGRNWGLDQDQGVELLAELLYCSSGGATGRSSSEASLLNLQVGGEQWTVESLTGCAIVDCAASFLPSTARIDQKSFSAILEPAPAPNSATSKQIPAEEPASPSPRGRMQKDTLRRSMIDAGVGWVLEHGSGHGAEQITYARVFERLMVEEGIKVNRGQVHNRIWASQSDFQHELLARVAKLRISTFVAEVTDEVSCGIRHFDVTSPTEARHAVTEVTRTASALAAAQFAGAPEWIAAEAVAAFQGMNPNSSPLVGAALHEAYVENTREWSRFFMLFSELFGYRSRSWTLLTLEEGCDILARCVTALAEEVVARGRLTEVPPTFELTMGDSETAPWELLGIGTWCLIHFLLEPIVGDDPSPVLTPPRPD